MRTRVVSCVASVLVLTGAAGLASQPVRVLGLTECVELALTADAGLRASELESAAANARLRELQGQYVPSVSVQAGYSRLSDVTPGTLSIQTPFGPAAAAFPPSLQNSTMARLSVQQPLFTGLRIASSIRQADAARASAGSDLLRARADLRFAVTDAYWQLEKSAVMETSAEEIVRQLQRRLQDVKTLLDQGVAAQNDVVQAEMRLEDARIDSQRAASAREMARIRLAQLIGAPLGEALDTRDDEAAAAPEPAPAFGRGLEELVARALSARPELAGARSRLSAQEAAVDVARAGRFPTVFVTGDYTFADPNPRVFPQSDEFTGTWSVGIMASFDIGRYPQVAAQEEQANARAAQAREILRGQSDAIAVEVVRAAISINAALATHESLKKETSQAEENARYVDDRFRLGVALESARLDAQSLLIRARLRERAALIDCIAAKAVLDRAVGE
jgi:outer membrane protein